MLHAFLQGICRAGIFVICAQTLVHFRPRQSYEKYLKLLLSTMIIIQLLSLLDDGFKESVLSSLGADYTELWKQWNENAAFEEGDREEAVSGAEDNDETEYGDIVIEVIPQIRVSD